MVIVAATLLRIARLHRSKFWVLSAGKYWVFVLETPEKMPDSMEPVYPAAYN